MTAAVCRPRSLVGWGRHAAFALVGIVVLLWLVAGVAGGRASAHTGNESYLYLDVTDRAIGGHVELPMLVAQETLGVSLLVGEAREAGALAAAAPALRRFVADHLAIAAPGDDPWRLVVGEVRRADQALPYASIEFEVDVASADIPRELTITFDPFVADVPDASAVVVVRNDVGAGVVDGDAVLVRFSADDTTRTVDLGDASRWRTLWSSIGLGIDHIRTGPDHVLFVLVLLLPSVLLRTNGTWRPAPSFRAALVRVLGVATMFTAAHTITFSLAGLGVLPLPPSRVTESVIALSIAVAALHTLRPVVHDRERLVAFAFGLFHGMGFASLVGGLETGRATQLVSLLGRNVGIEIGQATVILSIFPALFLLRRTASYPRVLRVTSRVFATIAVGWLIERTAEVDLGVGRVVEPLLRPAVAAGVAIGALALSAAWRRREDTRGRLLPAG